MGLYSAAPGLVRVAWVVGNGIGVIDNGESWLGICQVGKHRVKCSSGRRLCNNAEARVQRQDGLAVLGCRGVCPRQRLAREPAREYICGPDAAEAKMPVAPSHRVGQALHVAKHAKLLRTWQAENP